MYVSSRLIENFVWSHHIAGQIELHWDGTYFGEPLLLNLLQSHNSSNSPHVDVHFSRHRLQRHALRRHLLIDDLPRRIREHRLTSEEGVERKRLIIVRTEVIRTVARLGEISAIA